MTLEEMIRSDKVWLTPEEVAPTSGCNAQSIRIQAKKDPSAFGFLVSVCGNKTKISRVSYLRACGIVVKEDKMKDLMGKMIEVCVKEGGIADKMIDIFVKLGLVEDVRNDWSAAS